MAISQDILSQLAGNAARRTRKPAEPKNDPEPKSLLAGLRDNSLNTLGMIGNALDVPGSMVRDTITGHNPFDQLMTPFSSQNRMSGRDVARQFGMAGKKDTWGNAIGGFAAEVALDPLTYATLGGSALSKAGKAAKSAGFMDDLARVAAKKAGKQIGSVGKREARITTTLGDFVADGGEVGSKAQKLIDFGHSATEPLGGLVGLGVPFRDPYAVFGTGQTAQRVARGLDTAGNAVRFAKIPGTQVQPFNAVHRAMNVALGNARTPLGQEAAKQHYRGRQAVDRDIRFQIAGFANDLNTANATDAAARDRMRDFVEGVPTSQPLSDAEQRIAGEMQAKLDSMPERAQDWGINFKALSDDEAGYFPRRVSDVSSAGSGGVSKPSALKLSARDTEGSLNRSEYLKDVPGGTGRINEIARDPQLDALIESGAETKAIADYLEKQHGSWLSDFYKSQDKDGNAVMVPGRYGKLAAWLQHIDPAVRETGVFGNHPIIDYQTRVVGFENALHGAKVLRDALVEPDVLRPASDVAVEQSTQLKDLLDAAGISLGDGATGFGAKILEQRPDLTIDQLKQMRVSNEYASDLLGLMRVSKQSTTNDILKFVDNITNFMKAMWTGISPSFHFRNLVSGSVHNAALGQFDLKSAMDAHTMLRGGVVRGAKDIPAVRAEWARRHTPQQPMQPPFTPPSASFSGRKFESHPPDLPGSPLANIGNTEINKWTEADIKRISDPKFFSLISPNHAKLSSQLDQLVQQKGLLPEDATIMRLIYAQSNAQFIPDVVSASRGMKTQLGHGVTGAVGLAETKAMGFPLNRVQLKSAGKSHGRIDPGATSEGTRVLLHELGHVIFFESQRIGSDFHKQLVDEFKALSSKSGTSSFFEEFFSAGNSRSQALHHAGLGKRSGSEPSIEQFAEFFANSVMSRKIPRGALGDFLSRAMDWLRDKLAKLAQAVGLKPSVKQRLHEIIDELGGFNAPPNLDAIKNGHSKQGVKPPSKPPAGFPINPPGVPPNVGRPAGQAFNPSGPLDDEQGTKILGELIFANNVIDRSSTNMSDVSGMGAIGQVNMHGVEDILHELLGPGSSKVSGRRIANKALGKHPDTSWRPWEVRGVQGRTESRFGPSAAGEELGFYVEGLNRVAPFLNLLKKGIEPSEAASRVGAAQVLYGSQHYTPFQRDVIARAFPFAKFSMTIIPNLVKNILEHPGGPYAQLIRGENRAQSQGELAPDHVRNSLSIPIDKSNPLGQLIAGKPPAGTDRYLTGFGLVPEMLLGFGPGLRGAGNELISQSNPLVKGPLELITGRSFYQRGPDGSGKLLEDMDPPFGRLLANVSGRSKPVPIPNVLEAMFSNSPAAVALSKARTLTDPRKASNYGVLPFNVPGPSALLNTLTVVRITDVSPEQKRKVAKELLAEAMRQAGSRQFTREYFGKRDLKQMSAQQREAVAKLQGLQRLLAQNSKDSRR